MAGIHAAAAERLVAYDWPGNVRELENCMERAVALLRFEQVTLDDLPDKVRQFRSDRLVFATDDLSEVVELGEIERRYIQRVLLPRRRQRSRRRRRRRSASIGARCTAGSSATSPTASARR